MTFTGEIILLVYGVIGLGAWRWAARDLYYNGWKDSITKEMRSKGMLAESLFKGFFAGVFWPFIAFLFLCLDIIPAIATKVGSRSPMKKLRSALVLLLLGRPPKKEVKDAQGDPGATPQDTLDYHEPPTALP